MRSLKVILSSLAVVVLMGFFVPALAQEGSGDEPPGVNPNVLSDTGDQDGGVLGSSESVLPFTGGQLILFVVIGLLAVGVGMLVLRTARAKTSDA
ncbi:MAG: hypothetical protein ACRDK3_16485 [Actinomycetota bacterium]